METKKDVSYLGKDFSQFKRNLIDFAKQYFPTSYTDFSESSPGSLFIEMAAYVGDVLSYYADNNLKESLLEQAAERGNIYDLARSLGYRPLNVVPAHVKLDIFQIVPAIGSGSSVQPDFNYALSIKPGMRIKQASGTSVFRTLDTVDFGFSSSYDPTEITVYESNPTTLQPTYYLLKKQTDAVSGDVKTATFTFNAPVAYDKIVLPPPQKITEWALLNPLIKCKSKGFKTNNHCHKYLPEGDLRIIGSGLILYFFSIYSLAW